MNKKLLLSSLEAELKEHAGVNWKDDACPTDYNKASIDNKINFLYEAIASYESN